MFSMFHDVEQGAAAGSVLVALVLKTYLMYGDFKATVWYRDASNR